MGQMIKITYVGVFIIPEMQNFQEIKSSDEFYNEFCENGKFRTAYQGLESIDILIPCTNDYAIKDQEQYYDEFFITDFSKLESIEDKFRIEYNDVILKLEKLYPNASFTITKGIVSYWDEIA